MGENESTIRMRLAKLDELLLELYKLNKLDDVTFSNISKERLLYLRYLSGV